jgi:signal transduction histidine kinase/ActR/RegA family two-component response regulator
MIVKELLGEIMTKKGFLTEEQLEMALERQRQIFEEKALPERLDRASLVSQARIAADVEKTPLLGQILVDMEFVTKEQVEGSLQEQEKAADLFKTVNSEKLGGAIEVGSIVNSTLNLAEVLALTMRYANRVTNSVASTLMLLDDSTGELVFSVPTGPKAEVLTDIRIPSGKGVAGWVARYEEPALVTNAEEDARFYAEVDRMTGFETKSIVCVPLKAKKKLIGVLQVVNRVDGDVFTSEDAVLLRIFANQAAMAIENARLYAELRDRLAQEIDMQKKRADSEKFRALGQMASGMAHDFNNVLMGIEGNISLMLLETGPEDRSHEKLRDIEAYVKSGAEVTRQLLQFSSGGRQQLKPVDMNAIVDKGIRLFGRTKKEIRIETNYRKDLWTTEVNQEQIEQVLLNLFVNAWQAMPGGGNIHIETENVRVGRKMSKQSGMKAGKYIKVSITDSGEGMDKATRERIFEPFFTTKQMGRGTGLGLATAYGTIRDHGGLIDVRSRPGQGTTIDLYLPASEKSAAKETEPPEHVCKGTETILLVDDEGMIIKVCKQMLGALGYRVLMARGGQAALDILAKQKDRIDLIILNLMMPGMGGGETYDRIREIDPGARVLLSTGYSVEGEAAMILARGCDGFVQKPFNIDHLSKSVRGVLDKKGQMEKKCQFMP